MVFWTSGDFHLSLKINMKFQCLNMINYLLSYISEGNACYNGGGGKLLQLSINKND